MQCISKNLRKKNLMTYPFISIRVGQTCQLAVFILNDDNSSGFINKVYTYNCIKKVVLSQNILIRFRIIQ
jgi:hypothetical protein